MHGLVALATVCALRLAQCPKWFASMPQAATWAEIIIFYHYYEIIGIFR
jgi:hypothetical protein